MAGTACEGGLRTALFDPCSALKAQEKRSTSTAAGASDSDARLGISGWHFAQAY